MKKLNCSAAYRGLAFCLGLAIAACASVPSYDGTTLKKVGETLFVDPVFSVGEHAKLQAMMHNAKGKLAIFYGEQKSNDPDVIFCKSDACALYFSGTEKRGRALSSGRSGPGGRYVAPRPTVVITSQGQFAEMHLAHELSHIEHHARLGNSHVPTWFNEGVAFLMSGEHEFGKCVTMSPGIDDLRKLMQGDVWEQYTNDRTRIRQTYCQAAEEIRQWVNKNGKPALLKLMNDVKWGKSFDTAYGALLTGNR